jgi:hypothetical protein
MLAVRVVPERNAVELSARGEAKMTKKALISLWRGIPQMEGERA